MTTEEAAFQAVLDADPGDFTTRLVFADWLQERGDPRAEGYRALGLLKRYPTRDPQDGNWWFTCRRSARDVESVEEHEVIADHWFDLATKPDQPAHYSEASRREIEDEVALAFTRLPPGRTAGRKGGARVTDTGICFDLRGENRLAYNSREPEILLAGPAGTGKSLALLCKALTLLDKYPGCRGLFCRGTRSSLTESGLVTWEQDVLGEGHPVLRANPNQRKVRQSYKFPNGSELIVRGLDDPGKTLSSQYDFVYIMEATEEGITLNAYETLLRALRNGKMVKNGAAYHQVMMDCNPTTPTHWLYKRWSAGDLRMYTSTHRDNPKYWDQGANDWTPLGRSYVEETLGRMRSPALRARFYEGAWREATGVIYDNFVKREAPHGHLLPRGWRPEPHWRRVWGIDWGHRNPCCLLMLALDPDDRVYVYREFYSTGVRVEDLARWAKREVEEGREPLPIHAVCDHNPDALATFQIYGPPGCPLTNADKGDKVCGIHDTQELFEFQADGRPRIFIAQDGRANPADPALEGAGLPTSCREEFDGYVWNDKNPDRIRDEPVDKDNHAMDALRYAVRWIVQHTRRPPARTRPPRPRDPFHRLPRNTWR